MQLSGSKAPYKAHVVGVDPESDIAVLRINAPRQELRPLPLGSSSELQVGQSAIAIGPRPNPHIPSCHTPGLSTGRRHPAAARYQGTRSGWTTR